MEIVAVKFTRPQNISNMSTYRVGEIAGFSRQLADKIVKSGAGEYVSEKKAPPVEKKDSPAAASKDHHTK